MDISYDFALGKYPVTRAEYAAFARETRREWPELGSSQTERHPAASVSWNDAKEYVAWLSDKTGHEYRLPSEAEWEYAARAGTTTARYWGEGESGAREYARLKAKGTAPVGSFKPNAFGLHDMPGSVSEWVEDCWNENYEGAPADGSAWTSGDCDDRVLRGGSWLSAPELKRSATRDRYNTGDRLNDIGFRAARTLA